jgi:hypothetical protein
MAVGGVVGDQIDGSNDDAGVGVNVAVAGGRPVDTADVGPAITDKVEFGVGVVVTVCVDGGPVGVCCLAFCVAV